jgi:uncharacterized LabA/DUF88 family protein
MPLPRSILFVDGENLVFRYQAMLAAGCTPVDDISHLPDVFAWPPQVTRSFGLLNVVRAYYYTSVVGDDDRLVDVRRVIAGSMFASDYETGRIEGQLVPVVFKKKREARKEKTRNVDIQIVIDVMRFAFTDEIDRVYLASGDGDYQPLIAEVMRRGKQVEVLAFSSGLNESLAYSVDRFHNLDRAYFMEHPR